MQKIKLAEHKSSGGTMYPSVERAEAAMLFIRDFSQVDYVVFAGRLYIIESTISLKL